VKLKDDSKFWAKEHKKVRMGKYGRWEYKKKIKAERVRGDMIKMIPFSVLLIVPGFEVFIPAWIAVFPQGIPS
jgi:hypothetical protein